MTYNVLTYMKYNYHYWYAANLAVIMCGVIYSIFLNVLQFEGYNRKGICHPYFYQSPACRKLISNTIANDDKFASLRETYAKNTYKNEASVISQIRHAEDKASASSVVGQLSQLVSGIQNLGSSYLGNLRWQVNQPVDNTKPSILTQIKTLLDATVVDPAMTKYVDPLTRLYVTLSPAPAPAAQAPAPNP